MLCGRIPRLQEKIVDAGMIDGADRGVGVGIRGEQCPLGTGENPHRLLQKFHSVHAWHALVGQQQRHAVIPYLQLFQQIERALGRIAPDHPVFRAVLRTQIALDRPQNIRIVVHAQQNWFGHTRSRSQADK